MQRRDDSLAGWVTSTARGPPRLTNKPADDVSRRLQTMEIGASAP